MECFLQQFLENGERKRAGCGIGVTAEGVKSRLSPSKMKANLWKAVGAIRGDDEELEEVEGQVPEAGGGRRWENEYGQAAAWVFFA